MSIEVHTLTGAYALNAVTPEEAVAFERHLRGCVSCAQEVRELQEAAAQMGASEDIAAPPHLKARVLSAADKRSQIPPRVHGSAREDVRQIADGSEQQRRRWVPRLIAAAAAAVLIGGLGISQLNQEPESNLADGVTQVFEADDAKTASLETSNGDKISVATSPSLGKMAVDTDELSELSDEQVYQLWATFDGTTESAGILEDPEKGAAMDMPGPGVRVAMTIEPAGGSDQPTGRALMSVVPSDV